MLKALGQSGSGSWACPHLTGGRRTPFHPGCQKAAKGDPKLAAGLAVPRGLCAEYFLRTTRDPNPSCARQWRSPSQLSARFGRESPGSTCSTLLTPPPPTGGQAQPLFCPLFSSRDSGVSPALPLPPLIYLHLRAEDTPPLCEAGVRDSFSPRHPHKRSGQTSGQREPLHLFRPRTRGGEAPETLKLTPRDPPARNKGGRGGGGGEKGGGDGEPSAEGKDPEIKETVLLSALSRAPSQRDEAREEAEGEISSPWGRRWRKRELGEKGKPSQRKGTNKKDRGRCHEELSGGSRAPAAPQVPSCPGARLWCVGCSPPPAVPKAPGVPGLRCAGSGRRGGSGGEV